MIELGDEVIDRVSGFKGIAVARTEWLYGCARIQVQPKVNKEGKLEECQGFDELQLDIVGKRKTASATKAQRRTGGPRPSLSQGKSIKRF